MPLFKTISSDFLYHCMYVLTKDENNRGIAELAIFLGVIGNNGG